MNELTATNLILSKNGVTALVYIYGETENITKSLIAINPPKTTSKQSTNPADANYAQYSMRIIDILNKVEWRLSLDGYLDSTDSGDTAEEKRTKIRNMVLSGGDITIQEFGGTFDGLKCNIDKLEFKRLVNDLASADGVPELDIKISILIGSSTPST